MNKKVRRSWWSNFSLELYKPKQINHMIDVLYCNIWPNQPPPSIQFHHEITCYKNCRGDRYEESDQDENWDRVSCKGQGWRVGEYHKGGKEQEDEKRVGGMRPGCVEEEEVLRPIRIWVEERDKLFFNCVFNIRTGGWYGWGTILLSWKISRWIVDYCWGYWGWITLHVCKWYVSVCVLLSMICYGYI